MNDDGDPFWAERYRHGPITDEDRSRAADMILDAWIATRAAERPPRWGVIRTDI